MNRNIMVVLGHPDSDSYCGALATTYVDAAREAGHTVRFFQLGQLQFDGILHGGYGRRQALEPSLVEIKNAVAWANHRLCLPHLVGRHACTAERHVRSGFPARVRVQVP